MTDARQEQPVLSETRGSLGLITLNRPRAVNALTIEMIDLMMAALDDFEADPAVRVVAVVGAGDRGLCSGGDVVALYRAATAGREEECVEFFRKEYTLDHRISRYPKPYVALMNGLVLGGGIGISAAGSHRVVTESTRTGMPETGIGFSPDVGGLKYLAGAPGRIGEHLAVTGLHVGGADTVYIGIADHYVPDASLPDLLRALEEVPGGEGADGSAAPAVEAAVARFERPAPQPPLAAAQPWIEEAYAADAVEQVRDNLAVLAEREPRDEAIAAALAALERNSPTGIKTAWEGIGRARGLTLAQTLEQDFRTSGNAVYGHDMTEGIRAQVVDKDRTPAWDPPSLEEVSRDRVLGFFEPVPGHEDLRLPEG
jgi:enoyl-CoA hydratase